MGSCEADGILEQRGGQVGGRLESLRGLLGPGSQRDPWHGEWQPVAVSSQAWPRAPAPVCGGVCGCQQRARGSPCHAQPLMLVQGASVALGTPPALGDSGTERLVVTPACAHSGKHVRRAVAACVLRPGWG